MNKYLEKIAELQELEKQAVDPLSIFIGGVASKKLAGMGAKKIARGKALGTGSAHHRNMTTQIEAGLAGSGQEAKRSVIDRTNSHIFSHEKEKALAEARDLGSKARKVGAGGTPWHQQTFSEKKKTAQALREQLGKNYHTFHADRTALAGERRAVSSNAQAGSKVDTARHTFAEIQNKAPQKQQALSSFTANRFQPELSSTNKKVLHGIGTAVDAATNAPVAVAERMNLAHKLPEKVKHVAHKVIAGAGVGELGYHAYHGAHELLHTPAVHEAFHHVSRLFS